MKAALPLMLMISVHMTPAPLASGQTALDPAPPRSFTTPAKDPTEQRVQIEAGLVTIDGKAHRQATAVAVGASQVRFISPDGSFSVPWAKVPWNLRAKLQQAHAEASAKGQVLISEQRRRERLASLGLELIEGTVVGKTGGGMLVEVTGGKGRTVLLRGHPDQANIADQDPVSGAGRPRGTHEYSTGFFSLTKTARAYDFVPGE